MDNSIVYKFEQEDFVNECKNKYKFDDEVIAILLRNAEGIGFDRDYILTTANEWVNKNIRTDEDLIKYYRARNKIQAKLRRPMNCYEKTHIEKWIKEYQYNIDIILMAFDIVKAKSKPRDLFLAIDNVIRGWHNNNLKTCEEIKEFLDKN